MRVNPSVVIGLGSSGAYVVSNLERILYEVAGDAPLDLFRLISLDTDTRPKEDEPPPGERRGTTYSAHEANTGQAIFNLKHALGTDFSWCPPDLTIEGEGAGNLRAGGRLLLFNRLPEIWSMIRDAVHQVSDAALTEKTRHCLQQQFSRRGLNPPTNLAEPAKPVVYVVGTLAGGTCSGMCVDLGYAIRNAAPQAERIGVFFVPGRTESPVFLENTWATLKDLEFFCDNPNSFRSVWLSETGSKQRYVADGVKPFDFAYLISSVNQDGALRMPYRSNSSSPLVVMASMHLAAELLGMHSHVSASHVNITNQVQTKPKNRFFLNYNLRVISYPKYDISEAAACSILRNSICGRWLSTDSYHSAGGVQRINEEDIRAQGRMRWNARFEPIWQGLSRSVDLAQWVSRIVQRTSSRPAEDLHYQLTNPAQGTIYSQVYQVLPSRRLELQRMIKEGLGAVLEQNQNVRYAELYLQGIKEELDHTVRFWDTVGTPNRNDQDAWSSKARGLVDACLHEQPLLSRALAARDELLADELESILTRLKMILMKQVLRDVQAWIDSSLNSWLGTLRLSLEAVSDLARRRCEVLFQQMEELQGPVLKLGRSKSESLKDEVADLATSEPGLQKPLLSITDGEFAGEFAVKERQESQDNRRMFLAVKNELQSKLLRKLEEKGGVDIVQQIKDQGRTTQVIDHFNDAQAMSLATQPRLKKGPAMVPSFVLAKDTASAQSLINEMQQLMGNPPSVVAQALPMFDHMVMFYQEGACSVQPNVEYHSLPDVLTDAGAYQEHYDAKMQDRPDNLDPLASLKITVAQTREKKA